MTAAEQQQTTEKEEALQIELKRLWKKSADADKLANAAKDLIEQLHIYVNSDDADLPDSSDLERELANWKES